MMAHQSLIRLSRARSCIAHWESVETGDIRLVRVSPDTGPVPDVAHLVGQLFIGLASLRLAVLAAMKGNVGDTLDRVLLSPAAYAAWNKTVAANAAAIKKVEAADVARIPDERAREISGKRLLIWVDLPTGEKISLIIPPEQWAWRQKPN